MTPARLLESRPASVDNKTVDGDFLGVGRSGAGKVVEFKVTGRGGVDADASAVFLNVVAVFPTGPGFLTVFPCGVTPPKAANVNYGGGDVIGNAVVSKIGTGGKVCIFSSADTDLVVDVNGFVPAGVSVNAVAPARLAETRQPTADIKTVDGKFLGQGQIGAGKT